MSGVRNSPEKPIRVFVSHSATDKVFARQIRDLLSHGANARVFSTDELSGGERWETRLRKELAEADVVVALLTPASVSSNWVLQEIGAAWGLRKPIIPVITTRDVLRGLPVALEHATALRLDDLATPEGGEDFLRAFESAVAASHVS